MKSLETAASTRSACGPSAVLGVAGATRRASTPSPKPALPQPVAVLDQQEDAAGRVQLLAQAFQRVLQQFVEVVHRAPAAEDVRARLGELRAQLAYSVVVDRRRTRYESMTSATPIIAGVQRMSQRSGSSDASQTKTNAESARQTATAKATARQ